MANTNKYSQHRKTKDEQTKKVFTISYDSQEAKNENSLQSIKGYVNGVQLDLVLDTGATTSVISKRVVDKHNYKIIPSDITIKLADGSKSKYIGTTESLAVETHGRICNISFVILPIESIQVLLGLDWFVAVEAEINPKNGTLKFPNTIISINNNTNISMEDSYESFVAEVTEELEIEEEYCWEIKNKEYQMSLKLSDKQAQDWSRFMERNNDRFATDYKLLGACTVKRFEINTTNQDPIYMYPYRKSQKERDEIKMEVDKMMEAGIIRPSRSPYSFPVVITKKDKTKRFCVDYRKLNKVTTLDGFPLPRIDDLLDKLKGAKYFTLLDLKSGYWQIVMSEESILKTAFSTPDGHFEFLPFGLTNGPKEFSRIMNIVLGDLPFVIIFVDDITIFSQSFEEHLKHRSRSLEIVMARLREAEMYNGIFFPPIPIPIRITFEKFVSHSHSH